MSWKNNKCTSTVYLCQFYVILTVCKMLIISADFYVSLELALYASFIDPLWGSYLWTKSHWVCTEPDIFSSIVLMRLKLMIQMVPGFVGNTLKTLSLFVCFLSKNPFRFRDFLVQFCKECAMVQLETFELVIQAIFLINESHKPVLPWS